jgi:hypothetical protein
MIGLRSVDSGAYRLRRDGGGRVMLGSGTRFVAPSVATRYLAEERVWFGDGCTADHCQPV